MRLSRRLILFTAGALALGGLAMLVWRSGYWVTEPDDVGMRIAWWAILWIIIGVNGVGLAAIIAGAVVGGILYGTCAGWSWAITGKYNTAFLWMEKVSTERILEPIEAWWYAEKPPRPQEPLKKWKEETHEMNRIAREQRELAPIIAELDKEFPGAAKA